jgi:hypothetical protein
MQLKSLYLDRPSELDLSTFKRVNCEKFIDEYVKLAGSSRIFGDCRLSSLFTYALRAMLYTVASKYIPVYFQVILKIAFLNVLQRVLQ